MISQEDYNFIVAFDAANGKAKDQLLEEQRMQCAKTFLNLMGHVSKDQTIYYILVLVDEMLIASSEFYIIACIKNSFISRKQVLI